MNRRQFTAEAAAFLLGGAAITISGCGGGSPTASTPPPPDRVGTVDANHGHYAVITSAQQLDGGAVELDIRGTSSHSHKVTLSAGDVASVRNGRRVELASTGSSHSHVVVFNG
jgi:hypothetical protein